MHKAILAYIISQDNVPLEAFAYRYNRIVMRVRHMQVGIATCGSCMRTFNYHTQNYEMVRRDALVHANVAHLPLADGIYLWSRRS